MIELEKARTVALEVVRLLEPYCQRIWIAGSIRRGKPQVKDIDIVLIPSDPWNLDKQIICMSNHYPKLRGNKLKRFGYNGIQVDLYYATPETWATILLIRTGSKENNIRLCSLAKRKGWHLFANGEGLFNAQGERIAGDSEKSIYKALGIPYQEPAWRG